MLKTRLIVVGLIVTISLLLCGATGVLAAKTISLEQSQSGGTVHLYIGDTLSVVLSQQTGSTGYSWDLVSLTNPNVLSSLGHQTAPGNTLGGPGTDTWTFAALSAGTSQIDLVYSQPWSGDIGRTFTQTVVVTDSIASVPASSSLSLYLMIGAFATIGMVAAIRKLKAPTDR